MFKKLVIAVTVALWPLNLYLTNSFSNFTSLMIPTVLLFLGYVTYVKYPKYYLIPIFLISIVQINLLPFSVIFCLIEFLLHHKKENFVNIAILLASLIVFVVSFSSFKEKTIFSENNEVQKIIETNTKLYPNQFLAKIFQNEPMIYVEILSTNFYNLIDPNGYFFGNYPWPINNFINSFVKFSFLAIPFVLFGLMNLKENRYKKFIIVSFISGVIALMFLNNFDRTDFILWVPLSLLIIQGVDYMSLKYKKLFVILSVLLIIFSIPEYLRNIIYRK